MHQPSISSTQVLPSSSSEITEAPTYLTQHPQKENASVSTTISTDTNNISSSDHASNLFGAESNGGGACCGNNELDSFNGLCLECNHQESDSSSSTHNYSSNDITDGNSIMNNSQHNICVHESGCFSDHDEKKQQQRTHHDNDNIVVHSSQHQPSLQLLTVNSSSFHQRRESNGSSPTTPPTNALHSNNNNGGNFELTLPPLNVSTISSADKSLATPTTLNDDGVAMNDDTPSPTTANVRHNVLQKISKWTELDNYGTPLEPTHIIPLKTPIKTKFLESAKKWRPFTSEDFLFGNLKKGYAVAGIVDLSNHDCIYDVDNVCVPKYPDTFWAELNKISFGSEAKKDTFLRFIVTAKHARKLSIYESFSEEMKRLVDNTETEPLHYIKVRLVAKEIPGIEQQTDFNRVINNFFEEFPSHYIGVHCSYGFNRTGFICCAYLISEKHLSIDEALHVFAKSKPPGIKHHWFLKALRLRYDPTHAPLIEEEMNNSTEEFSM
ncbi:hypothetical protein C9374_001248 [Naegleria lovaniensis]|uniref:Tyrosine specific protein phosphatases domain-containing protein n=1 Tax=Naegleria lovaniensis TaxID=51637 RepID=A0AA88KN58_NAELO|nr:uncharacterized protein C9374_001248 [Naegleria lovaniensis]KAG2387654.1 hypothetical protein C9374_001248 [Naegleria lovaniensis]